MNRAQAAGTAYAARIDEVCAMIAAAFGGQAADAPQTIAAWARKAGLIGLTEQGLAPHVHDEVASAALGSSSMKANPIALTQADLITILAQSAP
jgi:alcohol dehydrogenase class IV